MFNRTRRSVRRRMITTLLALVLLAQPLAPIFYGIQTAQAQGDDIFLPTVASPHGPPRFRIINPLAGASISGFTVIAIESTGPARINEVSFQTGSTELDTSENSSNGFQASFDASALSAGPLELTVTATGPGGSTTQTRTVTAVPDPPSTATVGPTGGVLATDIGSIVGIRPGSVPPNTQVTVVEKNQEETTADHGLEWDNMGVTFLGAQEISTTNPISEPLSMVVSAGFGNRVQPNQVVVNYQLAPDANGDGISEIIVVNTASVAPNGAVYADPIPQPYVEESDVSAAAVILSGAPGEALVLTGDNFNEASVQSNVARFISDVDGSTAESPILAVPNPDGTQTLHMVIPRLPAGGATVVLENLSTFFTVGPLALTIGAPKTPSKEPLAVITDAINAAKTAIDNAQTIASTEGFALSMPPALIKAQLDAALAAFEELAVSPSPAEAAMLNDAAVFIENTSLIDLLNTEIVQAAQSAQDYAQAGRDIATGLGLLGALAIAAAAVPAAVLASPLFIAGAAATVFAGGLFIGLGIGGLIPPAQPGSGTTGMGSAPPPGGNGGGNVNSEGGGSLQTSAVNLTPGRFLIKLFSAAGTLPFTGKTDAGGYFFIPLIPAGEAFIAVAYDTVTGDTRTVEGIGPAVGDSVHLFFDFVNDDGSGATEIQIGDTIMDSIDSPGEVDLYSFEAQTSQRAFFDIIDHVGANQVPWAVTDLLGNEVFDQCLGCGDPGLYVLDQGGKHLMTLGGRSTQTGTYSVKIWNVPPPDVFNINIGDVISSSVQGPGAGNIESPGVRDIYTFTATAGQRIFLDKQENPPALALVNYKLEDSTMGDPLYNNCLGCSEPGAFTLSAGRTYTLTVGDDQDDGVGIYQLQVWDIPMPDVFGIAVGDTISDGVPGLGAGNIESPGATDIYTFTATTNQVVNFNMLNHQGVSLVNWQLFDSADAEIFDTCVGCTEPGDVTLVQGGTYSMTVGSTTNDGVGPYSIQLTVP